jgi:hypothetical protein
MYYAALNKKKKEDGVKKSVHKVTDVRLDACRQAQIWRLLSMPDDNTKEGTSTNRFVNIKY